MHRDTWMVRSLAKPFGKVRMRLGLDLLLGGVVAYGLAFYLYSLDARVDGWIVLCMLVGGLAAIAGLALFLEGAWQALRNSWRSRSPECPQWVWDRKWPAEGETRRVGETMTSTLAWVLFLAICVAIVAGYRKGVGRYYVGAGLLAGLIWQLIRLFKHTSLKGVLLEWPLFPLDPDRPMRLIFGNLAGGATIEEMRCIARCVSEEPGRLYRRSWRWRSYVRWEQQIDFAPGDAPPPGSDVEIDLTPPPGLPSTHLRTEFPTYWQLDIYLRAAGVTRKERFLLPVYRA